MVYELKLYKRVGDNPNKRVILQETFIEASSDNEAVQLAGAALVPHGWDDSDHAILWDGKRDVKHWTPNA